MNDKYNRAQFEQYAESQGLRNFEYDQDDASRYRNPFTQCEWNYWVAALECVAQAAHATPAQPVPVAKYTEEMRQAAEIYRIELQQMFDVPANPCEAAFKERTLSQGSQPKEWDDTAPVMVWYGYCEFKKGYEASQPSPSSVGAAIRALQVGTSGSKGYVKAFCHGAEVMREAAAALAEQVQGQQVLEGWKLVPLDPTKEMIARACKDHGYPGGDRNNYVRGYRSMLAAAPSIAKDGQKSEGGHGA